MRRCLLQTLTLKVDALKVDITPPDWHWYHWGIFKVWSILNSLYRWGNTLTVWDHFSSGRRLVGNDTCLYWILWFFSKIYLAHCLASQTTHSSRVHQHLCARCCLEEVCIMTYCLPRCMMPIVTRPKGWMNIKSLSGCLFETELRR